MAVITSLTCNDIQDFLGHYPVGPLAAVEPSTGGIENTTYFLTTDCEGGKSEWVLTLIEHSPSGQVDFTAQLLTFLNRRELPVPAPLRGRDGQLWRRLHGKPAWLIRKIPGRHLTHIGAPECSAIGDFLGAAHRAAESFSARHANSRGFDWLRQCATDLVLPDELMSLLTGQLATWEQLQDEPLPRGAIHADLFHDNALFQDGRLAAVIDFLFCCSDWLLLDIAIAVNDWCDDGQGRLDVQRTHALLAAYSRHRPFTVAEHRHWQAMLALAATRFWVSRLLPSSDQQTKDPGEYLRILQSRLSADDADIVPLPLIL